MQFKKMCFQFKTKCITIGITSLTFMTNVRLPLGCTTSLALLGHSSSMRTQLFLSSLYLVMLQVNLGTS